jgi:hypothetical protein
LLIVCAERPEGRLMPWHLAELLTTIERSGESRLRDKRPWLLNGRMIIDRSATDSKSSIQKGRFSKPRHSDMEVMTC